MYEAHRIQNRSDMSMNFNSNNSNPASLKAREPILFSQSRFTDLKAIGLNTDVHKRYNEKEHQPAEISCLPDSFDVIETHSTEAFFFNIVG